MFNKEKLFGAISGFGATVMKQTAQYIPAMLSEDKRFSNAYAACLALLICADLQVEADETISAIGFMQRDPRLVSRNLVLSTMEYYGSFIDELSDSFSKPTKYLLLKAKIVQEHIKVDLNQNYKYDLKRMCSDLIGPQAGPAERAVYDEIMAALV